MIGECSGRLSRTEAGFLNDGIDLPPGSVGHADLELTPCKELTWHALRGTVENEGAFRCTENTEDERTVDGLLEILERRGPEYQLTNDDARKLIDAGKDWLVANNLDRFTGLDVDIAYKLINSGYESQVLKFVHVFGESALDIVLVCVNKIELSADLADNVLEHLSDYGMDVAMKSIILWACARHDPIKIIQLDLEGLIGRAHV
mgnify:CR=1 FL=1